MLTGNYPWRKKGNQILKGDAALNIPPSSTTLPSILRRAGYRTGVVGKWHLGLGTAGEPVNWNSAIKACPLQIGFDHRFIMAATGTACPLST